MRVARCALNREVIIMKKRFTAIIAMIVALVMSFALIACNGDTNPGGSANPGGEITGGDTDGSASKRAYNAMNELLGKKGFTATFDYALDTEKSAKVESEGTIVLSGNRLKAATGDMSMVMDFGTGYNYFLDENNTAVGYTTGMPAGLFGHAFDMFADELGGLQITDAQWAAADAAIAYDKATDTLSYKFDLAEQINAYTENVYKAYKQDKSVMWVIDEYILDATEGAMQFSPVQQGVTGVTSIYNTVVTLTESLAPMPLGELLKMLKQSGFDVEAMLEENGMSLSELLAQLGVTEAEFKARTLDEAIVGAYKAVMEMIQGNPGDDTPMPEPAAEGNVGEDSDGDVGTITGPGMSESIMPMLMAALQGALTYEKTAQDPAAKEVVEQLLGMVVSAADGAKVKQLVDKELADAELAETEPSPLAFAIKNGIQAKEVSLTAALKLDGESLAGLNIVGVASHKYVAAGEETVPALFDDNNYVFEFGIKFTEISSDIAPIEFNRGNDVFGESVSVGDAVVVGNITEDFKAYVELGNREKLENTVVTVGLFNPEFDGMTGDYIIPVTGITYDKATSTVTVKKELLNEFFADPENGNTFVVGVCVNMTVGTDSYDSFAPLNVTKFPAKSEGFEAFMTALAEMVQSNVIG